ncbi:MAG: UpxY family transcription antiterminator [Bacteroidales bacterium]|nr:UpxY family transcription antiterminator [Bacteroidales bacterium]
MSEKKWHVLYTRSRFEKKVYTLLIEKGIETYLPLQKTIRQWKDRKKMVEEPLFRSYCFVKVNAKDYQLPLTIEGVVKYVWFDGKPATIHEHEIEFLKKACNSKYKIDVVESQNFVVGQKVRVDRGMFTGYEGEIVKLNGKYNVLFKISHLPGSLLIHIPKHYLKVL